MLSWKLSWNVHILLARKVQLLSLGLSTVFPVWTKLKLSWIDLLFICRRQSVTSFWALLWMGWLWGHHSSQLSGATNSFDALVQSLLSYCMNPVYIGVTTDQFFLEQRLQFNIKFYSDFWYHLAWIKFYI